MDRNTKKAFQALESVHSAEGEAHKLPRNKYTFYCECGQALRFLLRIKESLSDTQLLSRKALYRALVRGSVRDEKIEEFGFTKEERRLIWPWAAGSSCFDNYEASLTWLVIRNALWVGKKLYTAGFSETPNCVRCGDWEEDLDHAFYLCTIVRPLCELVECFTVRMVNGQFLYWIRFPRAATGHRP